MTHSIKLVTTNAPYFPHLIHKKAAKSPPCFFLQSALSCVQSDKEAQDVGFLI